MSGNFILKKSRNLFTKLKNDTVRPPITFEVKLQIMKKVVFIMLTFVQTQKVFKNKDKHFHRCGLRGRKS